MIKAIQVFTFFIFLLASDNLFSQINVENSLKSYSEIVDERFANHENDSLTTELKSKVLDIQKTFYVEKNKIINKLKENGIDNELMIYRASKKIRTERTNKLNEILTENQVHILELVK